MNLDLGERLQFGRLSFRKFGASDGVPVLLIHGAPGSWRDWESVVLDRDAQQKYHLYAVDRQGYGESAKGKFESRFEPQMIELCSLASHIANNEMSPIIVVGHSYGAPLAAYVAQHLAKSDQALGAVFLSGVLAAWKNHPRWYHRYSLKSLIRSLVPDRYIKASSEMFYVRPSLVKLLGEWERFPCPIALAHCQDDRLIPFENSEAINERAAERVVHFKKIEKIGHRLPHKSPQTVIDAIDSIASHATIQAASVD
ncbi:alpha/beta hydrolase [Puniceicoccaceae bacterium K14]|nr:alpha/beta hydrolase [Puniceicoccaceae bacterium K14]